MKKTVLLIALVLLLTIFLFLYFISSPIMIVCTIVAGIAASYFMVTLFIDKNFIKRNFPAPFLLFSFVLPIALGVTLWYVDAFSIVLTILLTSLTLVFFYNFLMIPLALYHHREEEKREREIQSYPEISILIPAYNEEGYVGDCIEAILEAVYPERKKEIIVIDDGSTDGTFEEAKRYEKKGVKVVHKENGGKHSALNFGTRFADGDIIFTIDADSIVSRRALKLMVKRFNQSKDIGAVAGNVKVINSENLLEKCQALEYLVGINIFRSAFDIFGAVSVVPGCLGAFRKRLLEGGGFYDPDTLTEDFDVTIKMRKLGKTVQASSQAVVYTEVPDKIKDLYNQRSRWYRGNFQTIFKHRNALLNPRFGLLQKLSFPFLILSMIFLPLAGMVVLISIVLSLLSGLYLEILLIFVFFNMLMFLTVLLAIAIEEEKLGYLIYAPLLMFGYKHILDIIKIKSLIDILRGKKEWSRARRKGSLVEYD